MCTVREEEHLRCNKKWRMRNRQHSNYLTYRSVTRSFIRRMATLGDIHELTPIIRTRTSRLLKSD